MKSQLITIKEQPLFITEVCADALTVELVKTEALTSKKIALFLMLNDLLAAVWLPKQLVCIIHLLRGGADFDLLDCLKLSEQLAKDYKSLTFGEISEKSCEVIKFVNGKISECFGVGAFDKFCSTHEFCLSRLTASRQREWVYMQSTLGMEIPA